MKAIPTMLVSLFAICLSAMSFKNKDFSFDQTSNKNEIAYQNTQQLREANTFSKNLTPMTASRSISGPVQGEQSTLWEPVTEIEDGAIYMIRCAENPDLYWDLTGGSLNNGTQVQLYNLNYSYAQKFYFKKSFDANGYPTYQLSPLYSYDKILRFEGKTENSILKVDDEIYNNPDKELSLYSDRIYFTPSVNSGRFYAHVCYRNQGNNGYKYVSVQAASVGNKIKIKDASLPSNRFIFSWEIIKTDYIGLQVGNKTYVNGTQEFRYVARVPFIGKYVIETRSYGNNNIDTYLRLKRDSTNTVVATNDDGGEGLNAKITYNFATTDEHSVYVRAYNNNYHGYCYVILRPEKTIYMSGTYDYVQTAPGEMINSILNSRQYIRQMGYFPVAYTNMHHDSVFSETDWEGTVKMNRDYYIFDGHGWNEGIGAGYYDGPNHDLVWVNNGESANWPNLSGTKLTLWIACESAKEPTNGYDHCLARFSAMKGAEKSFGFRGNISMRAASMFIEEFFKELRTREIEDAIIKGAQNVMQRYTDGEGINYPSLYKDGGSTEIRYTVYRNSYSKSVAYH